MNQTNQPSSSTPQWSKQFSRTKQRPYYHNMVTGESLWEQPEGVEIIDKTVLPQKSQGDKVRKNSVEDEIDDDNLFKLLTHGDHPTSVLNKGLNLDHNHDEVDRPKKPILALKENKYSSIQRRQNTICQQTETISTLHQPVLRNDRTSGGTCFGGLPNKCGTEKDVRTVQGEDCANDLMLVANKLSELKQKRKVLPEREQCDVPRKIFKTPIQDRFNKQKEELLEKQKKKEQNFARNCINGSEAGASKRKLSPNIDEAKRPRVDCEEFKPSPTSVLNPNGGFKAFDLRTKIEARKTHRLSSQSPSTSSSFSEMRWEDQSQKEPQDFYSDPSSCVKARGSPSNSSKEGLLNIPMYKRIYVVCDTNALVDDSGFVEYLIAKGCFLELPVTVVIPCVVLNELDQLKNRSDPVGFSARKISRAFLASRSGATLSLKLQEGGKSKIPVGTLDLKTNDDLVLNCCLQVKQECEKEEIPFLITRDNNLTHKATSYQFCAHTWASFKRWARGYKEQTRKSSNYETEKRFQHQSDCEMPYNCDLPEDEKMDVDTSIGTPEQCKKKSPSVTRDSSFGLKNDATPENVSLVTESSTSFVLCNCISTHLDEVKLELQGYVHNVIDEAAKKEYGKLKDKVNIIQPSWTFFDYMVHVLKKWFLITSSKPSQFVQAIISMLVKTVKKCNSDKEALTVADVESMFSHSRSLASMFQNKYDKHTNRFLETLNTLEMEWKEEYSRVSTDNTTENDMWCQRADVALQNIFNCLQSAYEKCNEDVKTMSDVETLDISNRLALCCQTTTDIKQSLQSVFQEDPRLLKCDNSKLKLLHKQLTHFSFGEKITSEFDVSLENVIELFQDTSYRTSVTQILEKFQKLRSDLEKIICSMEDY